MTPSLVGSVQDQRHVSGVTVAMDGVVSIDQLAPKNPLSTTERMLRTARGHGSTGHAYALPLSDCEHACARSWIASVGVLRAARARARAHGVRCLRRSPWRSSSRAVRAGLLVKRERLLHLQVQAFYDGKGCNHLFQHLCCLEKVMTTLLVGWPPTRSRCPIPSWTTSQSLRPSPTWTRPGCSISSACCTSGQPLLFNGESSSDCSEWRRPVFETSSPRPDLRST